VTPLDHDTRENLRKMQTGVESLANKSIVSEREAADRQQLTDLADARQNTDFLLAELHKLICEILNEAPPPPTADTPAPLGPVEPLNR